MEKKERQPRPIQELEVPTVLHTEAAIRIRLVNLPQEIRY
jgi:hypothetical protein